VQRVGFSCCPITAGYRQHVLANATAELAAAATGAYVNVDGHAAHDVGYDEGAAHGVGAAHGAGCEAPSGPSEAFEVGCTEGEWAHRLHEGFSLLSLAILAAFQLEIIALMACFRGLYLRSQGYLLDVVVVSLSLSLQYYVLVVEFGGIIAAVANFGGGIFGASAGVSGRALLEEVQGAGSREHLEALEELQSVVLFARCWRFIRVGHGIATSMNDMMEASKHEMSETVKSLRAALRDLESEIPAGTSKARLALHQVHSSLQALTGQVRD